MAYTPGPWTVGELSGDFGKDRRVSAGLQTLAAVYAT